jgi:replicative DNA helicase
MKDDAEFFTADNKDPHKALTLMTKTVMQLIAQKYAKQVVDFRDAYDTIMQDYAAHWNKPDQYGLQLGWPYFDQMSGGLVKGDLTSFVGRPQKGKTFQMLHAALHGWQMQAQAISDLKMQDKHDEAAAVEDQSRMFVSMEMALLPIQQRLAAMHTHVPMSDVKHAGLDTFKLNKMKKGLMEIQGYGAPFYVVDGNLAATVEDIALMARQLKPAAIFIDGAYLLKHPRERDRFKRAAENAELIKSELACIAPTCASWQFAKTAAKKNKKQGEKVDLEDIGYTDAIAQVSSIVLGLLEDDNIETLKQKRIEILKGRSGEVGAFSTKWDFKNMDFGEVVEEDLSDLQFV